MRDDVVAALVELAREGPVAVRYTVDESAVSEEVLAAMASIGLDLGGPDVSWCTGTVDYGRREASLECSEGMAYRFEGYRGWVSEGGEPEVTQRNGDIAWLPNVIWILDLLADPEEVVADEGRLRVTARDALLRGRPGIGRIGRRRRPPATDLTCSLDDEGRLRAVDGGYLLFRFSLELEYVGGGVEEARPPQPPAGASIERSQGPDRTTARPSGGGDFGDGQGGREAPGPHARAPGGRGPGADLAAALDELAGAGPLSADYAIDVAELSRDMRKLLVELDQAIVASLALRCSGSVDYGAREAGFTCDDGTRYTFKRYRGWLRPPGSRLLTPSSGAIPWLPNVIWLLDLLADPEEVTADDGRLSVVARAELMRRRPGSGLRGQLVRPPGIELLCDLGGMGRVTSVTGAFEAVRFTLTLTRDDAQIVA
ncbi:MAG: hypothetical protein LT070_13505 [Solirubrobacteraceae bacterium]|nr:hypothetical protein [Solirubrobacteraceae bacterium]